MVPVALEWIQPVLERKSANKKSVFVKIVDAVDVSIRKGLRMDA